MAARTTAELVRSVVEVDLDEFPSDASLSSFILTANFLVTEVCATSGYSDDHLQMIETWLAAHFFAIRAKVISSEGVAGLSTSYAFLVGQYLASTPQGQAALSLDIKGRLSQKQSQIVSGSAGKKAGASYLGVPSCKAQSTIGMTCLS